MTTEKEFKQFKIVETVIETKVIEIIILGENEEEAKKNYEGNRGYWGGDCGNGNPQQKIINIKKKLDITQIVSEEVKS